MTLPPSSLLLLLTRPPPSLHSSAQSGLLQSGSLEQGVQDVHCTQQGLLSCASIVVATCLCCYRMFLSQTSANPVLHRNLIVHCAAITISLQTHFWHIPHSAFNSSQKVLNFAPFSYQ